jgi:HK97 gp10 family phage protein
MGATIQGLDKLRAKLRAMPAEVKAEVEAVLIASAEEVASTARALAPVDDGDLQDSIRVTGPGESTPLYSSGGRQSVGELTAKITAGNGKVRYAHHVEFGHGGKGSPDGAKPRPFFWPAYRSKKKRIRNRIARAIGKAARKIWSK